MTVAAPIARTTIGILIVPGDFRRVLLFAALLLFRKQLIEFHRQLAKFIDVLSRAFSQCPRLKLEMQRFAAYIGFQATQIVACNRLHGSEERLARWLLMSHNRIGSATMPLTQEFLAQMLGARRTTVSLAASILQKAGMITYTRGQVTIADLAKLKQTSCDCYDAIQSQTQLHAAKYLFMLGFPISGRSRQKRLKFGCPISGRFCQKWGFFSRLRPVAILRKAKKSVSVAREIR